MSEKIFKICKALEKLPIRDQASPGGELDQLRLREAARAVIDAMREPTDAMIEKGIWSLSKDGRYEPRDIAATIYGAMIDAALSDEKAAASS